MKKGIILIAVLVAGLAVTSGAFAAQRYLITSSSQIKAGAVALSDLSPAARKALRGQHASVGAAGPVGPAGPQGSQGDGGATGPQGSQGERGATGPQGSQGDSGAAGTPGRDGAPGKDGKAGFSPTAFGPYASDSPDSSICGNNWANDKIDRSYVVYPQVDGSFLVAETFTSGTFTTIAGNSPQDTACGSSEGDVAGGITGSMKGYFLVKIPAAVGNFDPEAACPGKCYTKDFVQAVFGTDSYDVPVFEMHYSTSDNGSWKNASLNRGGNSGNIS